MALLATAIGCAGLGRIHPGLGRIHRDSDQERSLEELRASAGWIDPEAQGGVRETIRPEELYAFAQKSRAARKPDVPVTKRNVLVLTGGGSFGAYPAGVLVGWTESGTRPVFDVVTGTSTGALIGSMAFLGPAYDQELRRFYTCMTNDDLYRKRKFPASLLSDSLADNEPLSRVLASSITDERLHLLASEHRKGRRFYVGTTNLDTRRSVIWDMGAIAVRDGPGDRDLLRKILLASTSIPGFFSPVKITVMVDGVPHVERHIDGGTSSSMFFVPPWVPPEERDQLPAGWLYGSNLYMLVAGKIYADPEPVKSRTVAIASQAVSTVLYDQTRGELNKMFLLTILTGMNYNVSSIPEDLKAPNSSTDFCPEEMTPLFEAGAAWGRQNRNWRTTPPGFEMGEGPKYRSGTTLTDTGFRRANAPAGPDGVPVPVIPLKN